MEENSTLRNLVLQVLEEFPDYAEGQGYLSLADDSCNVNIEFNIRLTKHPHQA